MRVVWIILGSVWIVLRRRQASLIKIPANNLYYAGIAFAFIADPGAAEFFLGLCLLVLMFPLSADPLALVPRSRLAIWPVTAKQRRALRILSPCLNPVTWIVAAVSLWRRVALSLAGLIGGLFVVAFIAPSRIGGSRLRRVLRWVPRFPRPVGLLVQKNLRGLVTTLDFYCALIPAGAAAGYRLAGLLPTEARLPMSSIVLLAMSTCAQTLFGLDGRGGLTRYRLMPLRGWKVLLAKDLAFLLIVMLGSVANFPTGVLIG